MAKELTASNWKERIRQGQSFQEKFAKSGSWKTYKNYYRHEFAGRGSVIPVNLYYSLLRSMVPQVYFRNPRVVITPRKPGIEREIHARILQTVDNWLLQELAVKNELKSMIADTFLAGIGAGIIGYDSEFGVDPKRLDPTMQFSLTQFDKKGDRIEFNSSVAAGMPWFLRARPEDVIWPWGCTSAKSAEWFALRVFRPVLDVKADKKYSNTANLTGTFSPVRTQAEGGPYQDVDATPQQDTNEDYQWAEIFEVHDARTGKVYAVTMQNDIDDFLRNDTDIMQIEGLPVETLIFNPDPDFIYGVPDGRIIEPQQLELNEIRTQAMKHRRIDLLKGLIRKGVMKDEEIMKLTNEQVMVFAQIDTDGPLGESIQTLNHNAGTILQDMQFAGDQCRQDVREMVGFSRNSTGEYQGKTHISAAETNKVFQSLNIRLDERRDAVADLLGRVVSKFNQIIFTHWSADRVAQIMGADGAKYWVKFNGKQIKDEYDIAVSVEEGQNMDSSTKFNMGIQAAKTWAELNSGLIKQGMPVPFEIQRLIFSQFQGSGLDIDRLLAQTQATYSQAQQAQGGQSPNQALDVNEAAQMQGGQ